MSLVRFLHLEDNAFDAELVELALRSDGIECETTVVDTKAGFEEALRRGGFDIVLADHALPRFDGLSAFALCRKLSPSLPFIFVSGTLGEDVAIEGLRRGVTDYVPKSSIGRLPVTVRRALRERDERRERESCQMSLRESEDLFRRIFVRAPIGIALVSIEGKLLRVNEALCQMTGFNHEEFAGRRLEELLPPREGDNSGQVVQLLASGPDGAYRTERELLCKDGRSLTVQVTTNKIPSAGEESLQGIVMIEDITESKRIEQRRQSHHEITLLLASVASVEEIIPRILRIVCESQEWEWGELWMPDRGANVLRCAHLWHKPSENYAEFEVATRAAGFSPGKGFPGCAWASGRPQWTKDVMADTRFARTEAARLAGLHSAVAFPIKLEGGIYGVNLFLSRRIELPDPGLIDFFENMGNQLGQWIERKRAEKELRESEEKYRKFFEEDLAADFSTARDGTILACNTSFVRLFGFRDTGEALSHNILSFFPSPRAWAAFFNLLENEGKLERFEMEFRRQDGSPLYAMVNAVAVRDASGCLQEVQVYLIDNTQHKKLEEQFRQAQKMEAVGKLAGGVAHDFNNVVTVIDGYSDLIMGVVKEGEPLFEYVVQIKKAGRHAAFLTNQLLAFSRRQIIQPLIIDLNAHLRDSSRMLTRLIGEDVELVLALDTDLRRVKVDPGQIDQVIMNLAVNSRDAMPEGGLLTVSTRNVDLDEEFVQSHLGARAGEYALLEVRDTGCGMDAEILKQIFEPFFTTKGSGKGTGLGLSTVYGIVKQNGGYIWVSSSPGSGTNVQVYLPRADGIASAPRRLVETSEVAGGTETVLVVEDEEFVRQVVTEVLRSKGYETLVAARPDEAMALCQSYEGPIHLLLTDVVLPGGNGIDLAEALQVIRPDIKVVYMSGYTDNPSLRNKVVEAGTHFLRKPFSTDSLVGKIRAVLHPSEVL